MRKIKIETNKYYHVYNRGAGKQDIFLDEKDYFRFLWKIHGLNNKLTSINRDYIWRKIKKEIQSQSRFEIPQIGTEISTKYLDELSQSPKLVDILCYNLLPNHYHFILKQLINDGIKIFLHKLGISYAKYFNSKYNRTGVLFERRFEAYPINNEGKLCWLSAYVNCNWQIHKLGKAENWQFSSYRDYLALRQGKLANKKLILNYFNNTREYKKYCETIIKECQDFKKVKKMLMG